MHFKHNLLFFFEKKVENDPVQTPPLCGIFHTFFLTGSLRKKCKVNQFWTLVLFLNFEHYYIPGISQISKNVFENIFEGYLLFFESMSLFTVQCGQKTVLA